MTVMYCKWHQNNLIFLLFSPHGVLKLVKSFSFFHDFFLFVIVAVSTQLASCLRQACTFNFCFEQSGDTYLGFVTHPFRPRLHLTTLEHHNIGVRHPVPFLRCSSSYPSTLYSTQRTSSAEIVFFSRAPHYPSWILEHPRATRKF